MGRTEGRGNHDLHGDLRGRVDGVVGVGLVARVHAAGEGLAGGVKGGLGGGVVLAEVGEDDGVADDGLDLLRAEGEALGPADGDAVGGARTGDDGGGGAAREGCCAGLVGDDDGRGGGGTADDGLGDGDGLGGGQDGGCGAAADVDPEEVDGDAAAPGEADQAGELSDLGLGGREAVAVEAVDRHDLVVPVSPDGVDGVDVVDGLSQRQRRHAQCQC